MYINDAIRNSRAIFKPNGGTYALLQTSDYYLFGMISNKDDRSSDNKYQHNGKEMQDELGLEESF